MLSEILLKQFVPQSFGDDLWIGFAFGGFHDLTGEEVEELVVPALDFGDFVGVVGDDFINEGGDGSGVGGFKAHFLG